MADLFMIEALDKVGMLCPLEPTERMLDVLGDKADLGAAIAASPFARKERS